MARARGPSYSFSASARLPGFRWDSLGLLVPAAHLAAACPGGVEWQPNALGSPPRKTWYEPKVRVGASIRYRDLKALLHKLRNPVRCAVLLDPTGKTSCWFNMRSVVGVFADQELRPQALFDIAAEGQMSGQADGLELFETRDEDWALAPHN